MVTLRKRTSAVTGKPDPVVEVQKPEPAAEERGTHSDELTIVVDDDSPSESTLKNLRGRWELASVLNFLNVFGPLVFEKLKLTAEEIETGLIECNNANAKLHIALLKGILPVHKSLEEGDFWITVLCRKLAPWWPWVAKGKIPVKARKGEEIAEYKGLHAITRLEFLKALCELRLEQDDAHQYIQENDDEEASDSRFSKRKLGGDGNETSYWFDGNEIQGYRLYKEVNEVSKSAKSRKNACSDTPCVYWEPEATTFDEFQRVARELSSSKTSSLTAIGAMVETDAIPVVEKYHKKIERAIKKKLKKDKVVSVDFTRPIRSTRSCRNRIPASYTFEDFDKMIDDAVEETMDTDEDDEEEEERQRGSMGSNNGSEGDIGMKLTEDEAPESENEDGKENGKSKEDAETKGEFSSENMLTERPMNELSTLLA